jgi:hypothetical protein
MRPDVIDPQPMSVFQCGVRAHAAELWQAARFVPRRARYQLELRVGLRPVGAAELPHAVARPLRHRVLEIFADIEESEAEVAHQPLVSAAGGEVDPSRTSMGIAPQPWMMSAYT